VTDLGYELIVLALAPGLIATARGHLSFRAIWLLNFIALGLIISVAFAIPGLILLLIAAIWSLGGNTRDSQRRHASAISRAVAEEMLAREISRDRR
jgi:uncharacterized membrane protein